MAVTFDLYALVHTNCPILNVVILVYGRVVVWWGRWDLNPRPPGFPLPRSRAGYHTMLDNGPKRRNRAAVPNSIFLRLAGNSSC